MDTPSVNDLDAMIYGGIVIRIVQIIPAFPGSFVLLRHESGTSLTRVPVIAWGVWDEGICHPRKRGQSSVPWVRTSGPLVYNNGALAPASRVLQEQYYGVRVGEWKDTQHGCICDDESEVEEPNFEEV